MAHNWREHISPDGRKYYYNVATKKSTWQRPEHLDERDANREVKRFKKVEPEPYIVLELLNDWHLVICDTGKKFYYNASSNESLWNLPDSKSRNLIDALDKNKLVALIGLARGYPLGGVQIYDELTADLVKLKEDSKSNGLEYDEESHRSEENEEKGNSHEDNTDIGSGLVAGYSSSSSDAENEYGQEGLPIISKIGSVENIADNSFNKKILWDLFERYELNPYSAWLFEMKKIRDDPDFLTVLDDSFREDSFEEWCAHVISSENNKSIEKLEDDASFEEDELEPTKYHYLAHIVSKSSINSMTIFLDIKKENKSLFKKYKIEDFIKSRKDQESFVSKLLFYYKRMDLDKRKEAFIRCLKQHERTIQENISPNSEPVRHCLEEVIDTNDPYAVETKLLKMEKFIGLWGDLSNLMEEPKYYILGIRDKMLELNNYLKTCIELQ